MQQLRTIFSQLTTLGIFPSPLIYIPAIPFEIIDIIFSLPEN